MNHKFIDAVNAQLEGISHISCGPCCGPCGECNDNYGWQCDWDPDAVPDTQPDDEGSFSRSDCDSCGSTLAGQRFDAHGQLEPTDKHPQGELIHLSICVDCLQFHANGDTPEEWEG